MVHLAWLGPSNIRQIFGGLCVRHSPEVSPPRGTIRYVLLFVCISSIFAFHRYSKVVIFTADGCEVLPLKRRCFLPMKVDVVYVEYTILDAARQNTCYNQHNNFHMVYFSPNVKGNACCLHHIFQKNGFDGVANNICC